MMFSASHLHYIQTIKFIDLCWDTSVVSVTNSELTMVIEAPSEYLVLFINIEGMMITTEDILCILCIYFFNSEGLLILVSCIQHSTYFSTLCITPTINFAIFSQNQGVMCTTNYLFNISMHLSSE